MREEQRSETSVNCRLSDSQEDGIRNKDVEFSCLCSRIILKLVCRNFYTSWRVSDTFVVMTRLFCSWIMVELRETQSIRWSTRSRVKQSLIHSGLGSKKDSKQHDMMLPVHTEKRIKGEDKKPQSEIEARNHQKILVHPQNEMWKGN